MDFASPAASPQTTDKLTRDKCRYMICQAARKNTGQFCQKAETTLSGFYALFFELLVQGLDDVGNLQFGEANEKGTPQSLWLLSEAHSGTFLPQFIQ